LAIAGIVDEHTNRAETPLDLFDRSAARRFIDDIKRQSFAANRL